MLFLLFSLIGKAQTSDSLIVNQMKAVGINFYPDNEVHLIMSGKDKFDMMFEDIRQVAPNHFLLVPGVGAQGGSLQEVCKYGMTKDCGLLVNSSRGIIYASNGEDFAEIAGNKAREFQQEMAIELKKVGL